MVSNHPSSCDPSSTHRSSYNDCRNSLKHYVSHDDGGCLYSLLPLSKIDKILSSSHSHFFPVLISEAPIILQWYEKHVSSKIPFILNPLLFRSVRACRRVQWLDRCLWSSQSVDLVNLDVKFQEWDENVACGLGPITIHLLRGHLWNILFTGFPVVSSFTAVWTTV